MGKIKFMLLVLFAAFGIVHLSFSQELSINSKLPSNVELINEKEYTAGIRQLLYEEKYDLLDETASKLRKEKTQVVSGQWKLQLFYKALFEPASKKSIESLEKWIKIKNDSVTAHVALARALQSLGWKARGADVSEKNMRKMRDYMAKSLEVLDKSRNFPEKCPVWYMAMHHVAMGLGRSVEEYDQFFNEGVKLEPLYFDLYSNKLVYLLPKWYGEDGDWENFAIESYRRVGGKEGSALVAYLASEYLNTKSPDHAIAIRRLSWRLLKQGFIDLKELYGLDNFHLNAFCFYASFAEDFALAKDLFKEIGGNWDHTVWYNANIFKLHKKRAIS
jgi:hypothetical protein